MTWREVCEDKSLADLPYKIELNRFGQIVMSPTRNKHGYFQAKIAVLLQQLLPQGRVLVECAVDTPEGTKVADVAWATEERFRPSETQPIAWPRPPIDLVPETASRYSRASLNGEQLSLIIRTLQHTGHPHPVLVPANLGNSGLITPKLPAKQVRSATVPGSA